MTSDWRGEARGAKPKRSRSQRGIEACIISTAQQARPNVIHISEPVRAQLMRSSVVVTRKPLSASLSDTSVKNGSPGLTNSGLGVATAVMSIPLQRTLAPLIDEADRQHRQEHHHRPETEQPDVLEGDGPGEQECDLEVEDDEQDRDQVEAHVELHARIIERVEAALVGRNLL